MADQFRLLQLYLFGLIFIGYFTYSYNRKSVSFVIPKLLDNGLQPDQIGLIASSQNLAYAISKFLGGIASDRISSKILFSSGLLVSGLATILFSHSSSVTAFTICWFINGLAQGAGWPAIAKILKNWYSPTELGTWWSITSASANLSGCLGPFVTAWLVSLFGWRHCLSIVGTMSVMLAILTYAGIINSPADKGWKSFDKLSSNKDKTKEKSSDVSKTNKSPTTPKSTTSPMVVLIRSPFIWVISICYLMVSCLKTSITDWGQLYLINDCKQSPLVASGFVSSVELGGFFGGIAAGFVSDLYMRKSMKNNRLPDRGNPRMIVAILFSSITTVFLHLIYFYVGEDSYPSLINIIGTFVGFAIYGQIAIFGVVATQSVISEMSGTAHAIAALAANVGSILAGLPFAMIAKYYSWSAIFFILEAMAIFSTFFMLMTCRISYKIWQPDTQKHNKKVN